jgi:hypothetical protein
MQVSDLDSAANRQACEWLGEVAQRLNLVIEVVDAHHVLLCPVGTTLDAANVRRRLTDDDSSLRSTMADAMQSKMPLSVTIDGMQALCFGLAPGGVLLLARHAAHDESFDECRNDLESVGAWLTGAVESSLGQPSTVGVEPYRILSFRRILRDATTRGSFRRVLGAFVEALSVWDDVRVSAYVPAAADGFFQYVSTMAVRPASAPDNLDQSVLPRLGRFTRLPRGEADRLGLAPDPGDTLLFRFAIGTETEWALVFSGMIDDRVEVRLRVYSDILRESLNDVLTTAIGRIAADVGRRPLTPSEPLENAVQTALGQLAAAVGGRQAAMSLATSVGRQLLAVGNADLLSGLDQLRPNRLVMRVSEGGGVMTVAIERDQIPFAAFEREIIQAGAEAMQPWVQTSLQRLRDAERRHSFRPIDTVFDQLATEAVAAGQQASVIVMFVDAAALHPGLLPAWVGRIRGQLRGGDRAGLLSDHEIAVLLCGASADQAATVSARLQQLLEGDDTNAMVHPNIGMTTRAPDIPFEGSLVGAARACASSRHPNGL